MPNAGINDDILMAVAKAIRGDLNQQASTPGGPSLLLDGANVVIIDGYVDLLALAASALTTVGASKIETHLSDTPPSSQHDLLDIAGMLREFASDVERKSIPPELSLVHWDAMSAVAVWIENMAALPLSQPTDPPPPPSTDPVVRRVDDVIGDMTLGRVAKPDRARLRKALDAADAPSTGKDAADQAVGRAISGMSSLGDHGRM